MRKKRFLRKLWMGLGSGALASLGVWIMTTFGALGEFFYKFEAATYDYRVRKIIEPPQNPIEDIIILDIDGRTLKELGSFSQWPRTYWAQILETLKRANARMVAMDVLFDRSYRFPEEDKRFVEAARAHGNVFSAFVLTPMDVDNFLEAMASEPAGFQADRFRLEVPDELIFRLDAIDRMEPEFPELHNASAGVGAVNLSPDKDGISRRVPLFLRFNDHVYPTLAMAMAMRELEVEQLHWRPERREMELLTPSGFSVRIPTDEKSKTLIYYHGPFKTFRYISFYNLFKEEVPLEFFAGKVVFIGASAPGLGDFRSTPWQPSFPGVEVHANVLWQILNNHFIREMSKGGQFLFILLIGIFAGLVFALLRPVGGVVASVLVYGLAFLTAWLAFALKFLWLPVIAPFLTVLFTYAIHYAYRYRVEERDKREIKRIFTHYVSSNVVDELLKKPELVKLGGEKKLCTVLFSDLAGFTNLSEATPPEELVKLLNEYLNEMTHIVLKNQGTLDKYIGDAIMAIFGAPIDVGNHALKACATALLMQEGLEKIRQDWKKRGLPDLHQRIGINSGPMVIGNMGSDIRFDYTAIGDSVNLGARLEGANKFYGTGIMISEETHRLVQEEVVVRQLDLLRVKGKQAPVKVYELLALKGNEPDGKIRAALEHFQQGYENYLSRNWQQAISQFESALQLNPDDGPSRLYIERCREFMKIPPGEEWDGVYELKVK